MNETTFRVTGMSCGHCRSAITAEVMKVTGVEAVDVDLGAKTVTVRGSALDEGRLREAIDEAGYEAQPSR